MSDYMFKFEFEEEMVEKAYVNKDIKLVTRLVPKSQVKPKVLTKFEMANYTRINSKYYNVQDPLPVRERFHYRRNLKPG